MQKPLRFAFVGAALAGALVVLAPAPAQAQVRVEGRFRLPHGNISVRVGDPYYNRGYGRGYYGSPRYPVGSYVPYGYRVVRRARLGYGFYSPRFACRSHRVQHSHWVPVRPYGRRYVVVERPVYVERYAQPVYDDVYYENQSYGDQGYSNDPYYNFNREYWDRDYRLRGANRGHVHSRSCRH